MNYTAAFIGGGNMGGALIRGLIARGLASQRISVGEASQARRIALADELGVHVSADNREIIEGADVVVLAVKPQDLAMTVKPLAAALAQRPPLVLSIAAGIRVAAIAGWCGPGVPVARAMPNRPALNSAGATAIYAPAGLDAAQRKLAEDVLGAVGTTVWVPDEDSLDVVTALSGSGPAYFFLLAELMTDAAVKLGLPHASARELAIQTLFGSGRMARDSDGDLARLRAEVTSKGGTTEAAVRAFDAANLRGIVAAAMQAATDRGREMAQAFGNTQQSS
ncbi:MAG TPA: pyrroline-5-carboxylate reductase [Steroidobacteraceae bacterium]|jgi:pyrroline-5-carboxylate reductase|nr:pyrroline-5-carboxylate reductase [Steroidobacteraceae bacterium]